jgi:hypothetical protein
LGSCEAFEVSGRDDIVSQLFGIVSEFNASIHSLGNYRCIPAIDGVRVDSFVVANIHKDGVITTRGLRYRDELVALAGKWVIKRREHRPLWQTGAKAVPPILP